MNRRGFLSFLGIGAAASAVGVKACFAKQDRKVLAFNRLPKFRRVEAGSMYNYCRSREVEIIKLSKKEPFIARERLGLRIDDRT